MKLRLVISLVLCHAVWAEKGRQISFSPPPAPPSPPPAPPSPVIVGPPASPGTTVQSPGLDFSLVFAGFNDSTFTAVFQQMVCDNIITTNAPPGSYEICKIASIATWNATNVLVNGYFYYGWNVDPTTSQIQAAQAIRDQTLQNLRNNPSSVFRSPLNNVSPNCACKDLQVVTASSTSSFDYNTNLTGIPGPVQCGAKLIYDPAIANAQISIVGIDDGSTVPSYRGLYCSNPAVQGGVFGTPGSGSCRQYGVVASAVGTTQASATVSAPTTGSLASSMVTISYGGSGYESAPIITISQPDPVNALVSVLLNAASQPQASVSPYNGPYYQKPEGIITNNAVCVDTAMDASRGCTGAIATVNSKAGFTCTNADLNSATACDGLPCIAWAPSTLNQAVSKVTYPGVSTLCITAPTIEISNAFLQAPIQAQATAILSGDSVSQIIINPPGYGYRTTPTITIAAPTSNELGKLCSPNPIPLSPTIAVNSPIAITTNGQCQPLGLNTQLNRVCSLPGAPNGLWQQLNVATCNVASSFRNQPNPTYSDTCAILAQTFTVTPVPVPSPGPSPPQAGPSPAPGPATPSPAPSPSPSPTPLVCTYQGTYTIRPLYAPCNKYFLASGTNSNCDYNLVTLRMKSQLGGKTSRTYWKLDTSSEGSLGDPSNIVAFARSGCANKNLAASADPTTLKVGGTSWKWQIVPYPGSSKCDEVNIISQNRISDESFLQIPKTCDRFQYNATDGGRQRFQLSKVFS